MSATTSRTTYHAFVGGGWIDARSGETMEVINPATGEVIAEVPRCDAEDVDRAVEAAKAALPKWLETTPKERSELLHELADVLDENAEELAQIESRNVGKPLMASRDGHLPVAATADPRLLRSADDCRRRQADRRDRVRTRSSGRSSLSSASPTTTRRSRGRTTSATGWPRRCGPGTSVAR